MRGRWMSNWYFCIGWRRYGWQRRHGWRSSCWCWWRYWKSCSAVTRIAVVWRYTLGWRCCVYGLLGRRSALWLETLLLMVGGICSGRGTGISVSFEDEFWSWWEGLSELVSDADDQATRWESFSLVKVFVVLFRTGCGGQDARAICRRRYARAIWETDELLCNTILASLFGMFFEKYWIVSKRVFEEARVVSETVVNDEKDDLIVILRCGLGS